MKLVLAALMVLGLSSAFAEGTAPATDINAKGAAAPADHGKKAAKKKGAKPTEEKKEKEGETNH